jgi:phenylacetate-CoA ligase
VLAGRDESGEALPKDGGRLKASLLGGVWLHPARAEAEGDTFLERAVAAHAELLVGPPSALLRLPVAKSDAANAPGEFTPRAVQAWGECLGDERREALGEALDAPVYEAYRTRELGEIAHECEERNGLHVSMERAAIEFVRDGRVVPDGEDGEMFVTPLDNRAMPLFRFRIGDIGCRIPEKTCPCGRTSERILITDGRASELVTSPAGLRIHGDWFEWLLEDGPGIADWSVVQYRPGHVFLEVVRSGGWREECVADLRGVVAQADAALELDVRAMDAIPVRTDGRRALIVSHVPISWDRTREAASTATAPTHEPEPA